MKEQAPETSQPTHLQRRTPPASPAPPTLVPLPPPLPPTMLCLHGRQAPQACLAKRRRQCEPSGLPRTASRVLARATSFVFGPLGLTRRDGRPILCQHSAMVGSAPRCNPQENPDPTQPARAFRRAVGRATRMLRERRTGGAQVVRGRRQGGAQPSSTAPSVAVRRRRRREGGAGQARAGGGISVSAGGALAAGAMRAWRTSRPSKALGSRARASATPRSAPTPLPRDPGPWAHATPAHSPRARGELTAPNFVAGIGTKSHGMTVSHYLGRGHGRRWCSTTPTCGLQRWSWKGRRLG